jgi:hypothetical protein
LTLLIYDPFLTHQNKLHWTTLDRAFKIRSDRRAISTEYVPALHCFFDKGALAAGVSGVLEVACSALEAGLIEDMVRFLDPYHLSFISLMATYHLPGGFGPCPVSLLLRLAMFFLAPCSRCVEA